MAFPLVEREDIAALLASIALTAAATGGNSPHDAAYRRGFAAALAAVATGLRISPGKVPENVYKHYDCIAQDAS